MKKKLLMAALSIAMAFAAAVPAFADGLIDQKSASGSEKIGIISTSALAKKFRKYAKLQQPPAMRVG